MGITFLILLMAVSQALAQTPQPAANISKAHVEGVVLDGLTGAPIAAVIVSGPGATPTPTDAQGRFSLDPNSGPVTLGFSRMGYRPARLEGRKLPGSVGIPLVLEPGQTQTGLIVRLFPQPIVTGKVFDQRGQPMQDADVQPFVYIYNEAGIRLRSNAPGGTTKTNDLGDFRIENLDYGEYFFEIRPASPDLGGTSGSLLAPLFYPGTTDLSRAERVVVEPGARLQLKNVSAIPVKGGSLKVKLANQGDEPRGASILSVFRDGETTTTMRTQMIQKDVMNETVDLGRFPPGRYFVRAGFAGVNGGTNEGRVTIDVSESDQQLNLPIVNFKPWNFAGRAVVESNNGDTRPAPGIQLAFYEVGPNSLNSFFRLAPPIILTSQPDGLLPGRVLSPTMPPYAFHFRVLNPPQGMYVSTVRGGNSTRELRAEYGGATNLTVVLGENAGTIEGTLTDSKGTLVPLGSVVLLPDSPNDIHRLVTASTALNGTFRMQAGPGSYRLYAWREMIGAPYLNSEYMQMFRDRGTPVRVELGGRLAVNAKILED